MNIIKSNLDDIPNGGQRLLCTSVFDGIGSRRLECWMLVDGCWRVGKRRGGELKGEGGGGTVVVCGRFGIGCEYK